MIRPLTHPFDIKGNITGAIKAIKHEVVTGWHNKIVRYAAIAVAAYFTAGAAMAYFAAPAAAGGTTAASVLAAGGAGVGGASGLAATSAFSAGALGTSAFGVGAGAIGVGAGATAASVLAAGGAGVAGASGFAAYSGMAVGASGTAAGLSAPTIASATAVSSMPAGTSASVLSQTSQAAATQGLAISSPGAVTVTGVVPSATSAAAPAWLNAAGMSAAGGVASSVAADGSGAQSTDAEPTQEKGLIGRTWDKVTGLFKSDGAADTAATGSKGSLLGDMSKAMLIQGGLQMASALLQKPEPQMQFSGVNGKGNGSPIGIHTINGGFGLATGGSEPAPGGVPNNLSGSSVTSGAYGGSLLSNAGVSGQQAGTGNLGQTVANSVGVGGLIPQGAVDYMGANHA